MDYENEYEYEREAKSNNQTNESKARDVIKAQMKAEAKKQGTKVVGQAVKKGGAMAGKAVAKGAAMIGSALASAAAGIGSAVAGAIGALFAVVGWWLIPIILIIVAIISLFFISWESEENSRGITQNTEVYGSIGENMVSQNKDTGEMEVIELSFENKLVRAFYTYFSERSIWITSDDKGIDEPIQRNSSEFIKLFGENGERDGQTTFADKYNREKYFYLSPNALWAMDKYANRGDFLFPEQFIKPVYNSGKDGGYELKDLTDEDGNVIAESTKYRTTRNESDSAILMEPDESVVNDKLVVATEPGVWDYGFGSILNYKLFVEEAKRVGRYEQIEVWDKEAQAVVRVSLADAEAGVESGIYEGYKSGYIGTPYESLMPEANKESYMVDKVTSPFGTIENEITSNFEDSGEPFKIDIGRVESGLSRKAYEKDSSSGEVKSIALYCAEVKTVETLIRHEDRKSDEGSENVNQEKPFTGDPIELSRPTNECQRQEVPVDPTDNSESTESEEPKTRLETEAEMIARVGSRLVEYTVYREKQVYVKDIQKELNVEAVGTIHRKIPRYVGEPDTSKIVGGEYYEDYFANYKAYIPENVTDGINAKEIRERTGKDDEQLLALLERESFGVGTTGSIDFGEIELGSGASGESFKNSAQHLGLFTKYGEMYGVDPYLLIAIASQESSGNHSGLISVDRCSTAGCGIMQIEKPGIVITEASAFNVKTKQVDRVSVSYQSAIDLESNIKIGTMLLASRLEGWNYNLFAGLQAYNFGSGAFDAVLKAYSQRTGKEIDAVLNDYSDIGWLTEVRLLHENPTHYINWDNSGTYGDADYLAHVLQYYASPSKDGIKLQKRDGGEVVIKVDGSFEVGASTGLKSNLNRWVAGWNRIKDSFTQTLFPEKAEELPKERVLYEVNPLPEEVDKMIKITFALEEGKPITEYETMTGDMWKEKFKLWFSNPLGTDWTPEVKSEFAQSELYFPNGYTKPIARDELVISKGYSASHLALDIRTPLNSAIIAVADGEVVEVGNSASRGKYVRIKHANNVETIYGSLSATSLAVGDKVTQGQAIAFSGNSSNEGDILHLELFKDGQPESPIWLTSKNFVRPTTGPITLEYASTESPYSATRPHLGVDYGVPIGTNVVAVSSGEVLFASTGHNGGYGNKVTIKHRVNGVDMISIYGHLDSIKVKVGDKVTSGQVIGLSGNTGDSTGPHLHIELLSGVGYEPASRDERFKYTVNPAQFF